MFTAEVCCLHVCVWGGGGATWKLLMELWARLSTRSAVFAARADPMTLMSLRAKFSSRSLVSDSSPEMLLMWLSASDSTCDGTQQ